MNKLLTGSKLFLKRNASTILTCAGAVGTVATTIMAAKATPKAVALIEEAKAEKKEDLTTIEKVKVAGPVYIPTVLAGVSTVACILGANALSKRQQASLMSAYALLDNSYKEYKKKAQEISTNEVDIEKEIVKDKYEGEYGENKPDIADNKMLFFDYFSNRYFESTIEDVQRAEYRVNRNMIMYEAVSLNEFYDMLGVERVEYGDEMGWTRDMCNDLYWQTWIDFTHKKVVMEDGLECRIVQMLQEPVMRYYDYC